MERGGEREMKRQTERGGWTEGDRVRESVIVRHGKKNIERERSASLIISLQAALVFLGQKFYG